MNWHGASASGLGGRQQAPLGAETGQVVAEQVEPAPCHWPWSATQAAWVLMEQLTAPLPVMQHAPVAGAVGQELAEHAVPLPRYTPPGELAHPAAVLIEQSGPAKPCEQHAPVAGGAQIVLEQTVPAPFHWPWHAAWVVMVQVMAPAVVTQHAPVGGVVVVHELFVQTVPAPCQVPWMSLHCACVSIAHVSVPGEAARQHAPV